MIEVKILMLLKYLWGSSIIMVMEIFLQIVLLVVGFGLLIKGADWFVDGASGVASYFKVPKTIIGLTIVAFGTSAPEFAVSVQSLMSGNAEMLLGNVIGSNILNILLILGIVALIKPITVKSATVQKELPMTILLTTLLATLISDRLFNGAMGNNDFTQQDGVVLVIAFLIFIYYLVRTVRRNNRRQKHVRKKELESTTELPAEMTPMMPLWKSILFTLLGLAGIIVGSNLVVNNASGLAATMGISERIVALTVVAIGTSLPELVTSVVAARKGETDLAVGNVVGSNIFNIGIVAGIPVAIMGGIPNIAFSVVDVVIVLAATILLYFFTKNDHKISRWEGVIFLTIFVGYYGYLIATTIGG